MPNYKILVVDDESSVRETIRMLLQYYGHTIMTAHDAETAIALMKSNTFQIVISDYHMPGMKGDQLAAHVKQHQPGTPVIMVTALPDHLMVDGKLNVHVDALLTKPFHMTELIQAVTKVMMPPEKK